MENRILQCKECGNEIECEEYVEHFYCKECFEKQLANPLVKINDASWNDFETMGLLMEKAEGDIVHDLHFTYDSKDRAILITRL